MEEFEFEEKEPEEAREIELEEETRDIVGTTPHRQNNVLFETIHEATTDEILSAFEGVLERESNSIVERESFIENKEDPRLEEDFAVESDHSSEV